MAKTKISEFDVDPSNNTDINSINIAEGCAPSGINNAIRQLMSDLKEQQTGASGDNFTVGGNLAVTGTSVFTGATTFTGAVVFSSAVSGVSLTSPTITTPTITGLTLNDSSIVFEGSSADAFETTLTVTNPTEDRTLTLPNASDTLVGRATTDTLTNKTVALGSNTVSGTKEQFNTAVTDTDFLFKNDFDGSAPIYGVRAWARFDCTKNESNAINSDNTNRYLAGSGNIARILKNSTGNYTVTFTTAMPDNNYAISFSFGSGDVSASDNYSINLFSVGSTAFSFNISDATGNSYQNPPVATISVVR